MNDDWRELKLGDVINLKRGYDLPTRLRKEGDVPIFSSSGISGFHDEEKIQPPGVVTGRYGTIGQVFLAKTAFWPLNTTLYVEDFKGNDEVFIYYFLQQINWEQFNDKSAVPGVNRNDAHQEDVVVPPLIEQKAITAVLASLDDKIDLLHRQNKTLESIAQTLFRHWFIDGAEDDWEKATLQDVCDIRRGASPRPIQKYVENGTVPWIKIADATGSSSLQINETKEFIIEAGVSKSVEVFPGDLILSNSATAGLPFFVGLYGCIHDGWLLFRDFTVPKNFIYFLLHFATSELDQMADGTVQKNLNTTLLKEYPFNLPPSDLLIAFDEQAELFIKKIKANNIQIQTLEKLRDTLLPKLMSGEVKVAL